MRRTRSITLIILIFFTEILLIGMIELGNSRYLQSHNDTTQLDTIFQFTEFINDIDKIEDISLINFALPSSEWNLTGLNIDFTDIKLERESITIEDGGESFERLNKGINGYGVQLNITEPTILFGVEIYGYLEGTPISDVFVEIRAYEGGLPNNTIFGSPVQINMTNIPGWYTQSFPEPISLDIGNYFLAINGSDYNNNIGDSSDYHLFLNEINSIHSNIVTVKYDISWSSLDIGKPFRHKLIQRVNRSYNPENINMTAEIDGNLYSITNGIEPFSGNLTINNLNFALNDDKLRIPIYTNQNIELLFNLSYNLALKRIFSSDGEVLIQEDSNNIWSIFPSISRIFVNHTIKIEIPSSWKNLTVFKNDISLSQPSEILTVGNILYILNNTINNGANWEIKAESTKVNFILNFPVTQFEPTQELKFSVNVPFIHGNLTFIFIDALGFEAYYEEKEVISSDTSFIYDIPSNPHKGDGKVYVFWINDLEAGVQTQQIEIIIPFKIDPQVIYYTVIILSLSIAIVTTIYFSIKKVKAKQKSKRKRIVNKFIDALNLNYVMIIDKKSGLGVYEEYFGGKSMDTTLIVGFLDAIRSFGIELTGASSQSQTVKLEYKESKILMSEFKNFRIITIMKETPSEDFLKSLISLSYDIDEDYGILLQNFNGNLDPFKDIKDLIKKHLNTVYISPLKVVLNEDIKLNIKEKTELRKAQTIMKQNKMEYFFSSSLLPNQSCEFDFIEGIFRLINKNVFQPFDQKEIVLKN